jgi:uncharacterized repeat protein (TIGR03803 family)
MTNIRNPRNWLPWLRQPGCGLALAILLAISSTRSAQAQTFTTIHSFTSSEGTIPVGSLVQGDNGNLYGPTESGGDGGGTIFEISPSGTYTTVANFDVTDGQDPLAAVVQETNGSLYGTTYVGGSDGDGVVFDVSSAGELNTLVSFNETNGKGSEGSLVQASNGDLYGTTAYGGSSGDGTVFKITTSGTLTTVHEFSGSDGETPIGGLLQAGNGNIYGTTSAGGANGLGTVFEISSAGTFSTVHSFEGTDGSYPFSGLIQATNGGLYGTTQNGGANKGAGPCHGMGCGTVYEITTAGKVTTIYSFCSKSGCTDGDQPDSGVIQATNGDLYGTAEIGGSNTKNCVGGCGVLFKLTLAGAMTTLHSFCSSSGCTDGENPGGLFQHTNGKIYGVASGGGTDGYGTVFSLSIGAKTFIETLLTQGAVGSAVTILGTDLTGATSVEFNGKAATFTVVSSTEITTTVPSGATTGFVTVKTPSATLTSNVKFGVS